MTDARIREALHKAAEGAELPYRFRRPSAVVLAEGRHAQRRWLSVTAVMLLLAVSAGLGGLIQSRFAGGPESAPVDSPALQEAPSVPEGPPPPSTEKDGEAAQPEQPQTSSQLTLTYPLYSQVVAQAFTKLPPDLDKQGNDGHPGVDFASPAGRPVMAAAAGTVRTAGPHTQLGNLVTIDHGLVNGQRLFTWYAHNSELKVQEGQRVGRGEVIALTGTSGKVLSTGPHLHFEVRVDGTPVDPLLWLK